MCYMLLNLILLQNCIAYVECSSSSTGHFFQLSKNLRKGDYGSNGEMSLKPEFFASDRHDSRSHVVRNQTAGKYQTISDGHDELIKKDASFDVVWKKIPKETECKSLYNSGHRRNGLYYINLPGKQVLQVYCDMETDGGGWTVIQRRIDNSANFQRNWTEYQHGFGDSAKNMWIGLDNMHSLASPEKSTTLRVELMHLLKGNTRFYAKYGSFKIYNETERYRLHVAQYSGTAGDAFDMIPSHMTNNGMDFTTYDRDNDKNLHHNCAVSFKGGWWYNGCHNCQLNGLYPNAPTTHPSYISWKSIDGLHGNIFFSEMKIRSN